MKRIPVKIRDTGKDTEIFLLDCSRLMTFSSSPLSKNRNRLPLSKPKAHDELASPGMGQVGQVGELSGNFQPNCDALISAGNIDAATHACTDGAGANNGKFNDGRLDQPADAENAETVG